MIIESIRLENFKSHEYTDIEFNPGISIIMGENGAGKSSILEAVSFALFKEHKTKIDQLVQNNKNRMRVILNFSSNGRRYQITRKRKRGTNSSSYLKIMENNNYQTLISGEKQVNHHVKDILEMDSDLFLNAVYVKQGEIADLINKTASEKQKMIGKLLGIENLQKSWENMRNLINTYNRKMEHLKGKLENLDKTRDELKNKKEHQKNLIRDIENLTHKISEFNRDIEKINEEKDHLDEKESKFQSLNTAVEKIKPLLEKNESQEKRLIENLKSIDKKEKRLNTIKPLISRLDPLKNLDKNIGELKFLHKDKQKLEESLIKINKYKKILSDNEEYYKEYLELSSKIEELDSKREEFEGSKSLKDQYFDRKKILEEKISTTENLIKNSLENYGKLLGEEFNLVEDLELHLNSIEPLLENEIEKITKEIEAVGKDLIEHKTQIKNFQKPIQELDNVKGECPICQSPISPIKREELINNYQSEIKVNKGNISILKENRGKLDNKRSVLYSKMEIISEINIGVLKEKLHNLKENKKEHHDLMEKIEINQSSVEKLDKIDEMHKKYGAVQDNLEESFDKYREAENILKSFDLTGTEEEMDKLSEEIKLIEIKNQEILEELEIEPEKIKEEITKLEKIKEEYGELKGQISYKNEYLSNLAGLREDIAQLDKKLKQCLLDLDQLDYDGAKHQDLIQTLTDKKDELNVIESENSKKIGQKEELSSTIKGLEEKLQEFEEDKKELQKVSEFRDLLKTIRNLFHKDGLQKDLRNISRPLIEQNTREFFEKFNFEYSDIKLDENYDITVYGPSGENQLEMVSGGERIAIALALRLGITQVLSKGALEMIMLDEPTIHLDSFRRKELVELLKQMSIIPQMIIVTHDVDLEEAADNILKIEKQDGISLLTS
ncbi:MAG: AAA family ATPase [Methanomicrobiales archaeon]